MSGHIFYHKRVFLAERLFSCFSHCIYVAVLAMDSKSTQCVGFPTRAEFDRFPFVDCAVIIEIFAFIAITEGKILYRFDAVRYIYFGYIKGGKRAFAYYLDIRRYHARRATGNNFQAFSLDKAVRFVVEDLVFVVDRYLDPLRQNKIDRGTALRKNRSPL